MTNKMAVKNGNKFTFVQDCVYARMDEFLATGVSQVGGIEVDGKWVDEASKAELRKMWNEVVKMDFVKEVDEDQFFVIPAGLVVTIDDIDWNGMGTLTVNNRVRVHITAFNLVTHETEDDEEMQIELEDAEEKVGRLMSQFSALYMHSQQFVEKARALTNEVEELEGPEYTDLFRGRVKEMEAAYMAFAVLVEGVLPEC